MSVYNDFVRRTSSKYHILPVRLRGDRLDQRPSTASRNEPTQTGGLAALWRHAVLRAIDLHKLCEIDIETKNLSYRRRIPSSGATSSTSPAAILAIMTARAFTSAERFSPLGPVGMDLFPNTRKIVFCMGVHAISEERFTRPLFDELLVGSHA